MLNYKTCSMRKYVLLSSLSFIVSFALHAQKASISGFAPAYVGKSIEVYEIEDYISMKERILATTTVDTDSSFSLTFPCETTQKVLIRGMNNSSFLYVQPEGNYRIFMPDRDKFDPYRPAGNQVELSFLELDSLDINYKILGFQRWVDDFGANNFYYRTRDPVTFGKNFDLFKANVERVYKSDSMAVNSDYFRTFVRYTIASLDNIQFAAERNRYEKHDFYLKHNAIHYGNDAYMQYVNDFYQEMVPRLPSKTNQAMYVGVLKSSPIEVLNALKSEYTLLNLRIREMIMLKALSEEYRSGTFPQTNILNILDSVAQKPLFKANGVIAKNLKDRLTDLVPGGQAPDFVLAQMNKPTKTLLGFRDKYVYLHFVDPSSEECMKELDVLKGIHSRYGNYVQFVSVYKTDKEYSEDALNQLNQVEWDVYGLPAGNSIWKNYRANTFPHYSLIDVTGNIVASPALGPRPNGEYETIDKVFFEIKTNVERRN